MTTEVRTSPLGLVYVKHDYKADFQCVGMVTPEPLQAGSYGSALAVAEAYSRARLRETNILNTKACPAHTWVTERAFDGHGHVLTCIFCGKQVFTDGRPA